jgi:6-pyruvoyltetrahydropterin/6-carboxytetrahydropterin synthase
VKLPIAQQRAPRRTGPVMRVSRVYAFQAAHRLPLLPAEHKCSRLHGHSYEVEVEVAGQCDELGWIVDFARLDAAWDALGAHLDHRYLNEIEGLHCPTSERIALYLWERFETYFAGDVALERVTVRENGRSSATCTSSKTAADAVEKGTP